MASPFAEMLDEIKAALIDSTKVSPAFDHVSVGRRVQDWVGSLYALLVTENPVEAEPENHGASVYAFPVVVRCYVRVPDDLTGETIKATAEEALMAVAERYRYPIGKNLVTGVTNLLWTESDIISVDDDDQDIISLVGRVRVTFYIAR